MVPMLEMLAQWTSRPKQAFPNKQERENITNEKNNNNRASNIGSSWSKTQEKFQLRKKETFTNLINVIDYRNLEIIKIQLCLYLEKIIK